MLFGVMWLNKLSYPILFYPKAWVYQEIVLIILVLLFITDIFSFSFLYLYRYI